MGEGGGTMEIDWTTVLWAVTLLVIAIYSYELGVRNTIDTYQLLERSGCIMTQQQCANLCQGNGPLPLPTEGVVPTAVRLPDLPEQNGR